MEIREYLKSMVKDFITACGFLMVLMAIYLGLYSITEINVSFLFQIIIIALSFTFYKFAFINKFELKEKANIINFSICTTLADIMIIVWLWLFSPRNIIDNENIVVYIIIIFVVKAVVFAMMYINGREEAKELNEKLNEYKKSAAK
ncbi:DUF3021 family protein [Clostridium paridis]|uniref:DUF3021 family protein n=1 Tax=Clostridium paridis TaxID=2803863 RepID=A0A937K2J2_9CLOT|nr:DUF3021 family protein [Clostridium paridis]MBL4930702.1 DUF3021 family protein [Clostridium paridis]